MRDNYIKGNCESQSTQTLVIQNNVSKFEVKLETRDLAKEKNPSPNNETSSNESTSLSMDKLL